VSNSGFAQEERRVVVMDSEPGHGGQKRPGRPRDRMVAPIWTSTARRTSGGARREGESEQRFMDGEFSGRCDWARGPGY